MTIKQELSMENQNEKTDKSASATTKDAKDDAKDTKDNKDSRRKLFNILKISIPALILAAIVGGSYLGVSAYIALKEKNSSLNSELATYKDRYDDKLVQVEMSDREMKQRLLDECGGSIIDPVWQETCEKLKSGTEKEVQEILDQYIYSRIKQVNLAMDEYYKPIPNQYVGGQYAPYWTLHNLNITVPNGIAMERTIDFRSNGILGKFDNEGFPECIGIGILTEVSTTITSSKNTFKANAYAQSYNNPGPVRSCSGDGSPPLYIPYAKYEPLPNYPDKTYMEVAAYRCTVYEASCANGEYDTKEWYLHSGIISTADSGTIVMGTVVLPTDIYALSYVGDTKNFSFEINVGCSPTRSCSTSVSTYEEALAHSEYKELKDIIFTLQRN